MQLFSNTGMGFPAQMEAGIETLKRDKWVNANTTKYTNANLTFCMYTHMRAKEWDMNKQRRESSIEYPREHQNAREIEEEKNVHKTRVYREV